ERSASHTRLSNSHKTISYAHSYGHPCTDSLVVTVFDSNDGAGTASLTITIANPPPAITSLNGPTSARTGQHLSYYGTFSDPDPRSEERRVGKSDGSGDRPPAEDKVNKALNYRQKN